MDYKLFFWIVVTSIFSTIPLPLIKTYTKEKIKNELYVFISIVFNIFLIYLYIIVFNNESITIVYAIIKVLSILLTLVVDITLFKTVFTSSKIVGLILAVVSVILLSYE
uniref:EamA domain-containing protein n=1 Tax=viral metagenome TaxID=1070528 RepID=A0A6C0KUI7_9ZZZZ